LPAALHRLSRLERRPGALAVALQAVTAGAALQEDLFAAQQVLLRHGKGIGGKPVAAVDLREVGRLLELVLGWLSLRLLDDRLVRTLEARIGLREALNGEDDVLRVELSGVAQQPGLA